MGKEPAKHAAEEAEGAQALEVRKLKKKRKEKAAHEEHEEEEPQEGAKRSKPKDFEAFTAGKGQAASESTRGGGILSEEKFEDQAICEELLLGVLAHRGEGQHGQGGKFTLQKPGVAARSGQP